MQKFEMCNMLKETNVPATQKVNPVLGCIKRGVIRESSEVVLSLPSALLSVHLEYCIQLWGPQCKKVLELLYWVPRRAMKMMRRLEQDYAKNRWESWGEENLEDLGFAFQCIKGAYKKDREGYFSRFHSDRKRINEFQLKDDRLKLGIRKKFIMVKVVRHRNKLPKETMDASVSVSDKVGWGFGKLDQVKNVSAHGRRGITIWPLKVSPSCNCSMMSLKFWFVPVFLSVEN